MKKPNTLSSIISLGIKREYTDVINMGIKRGVKRLFDDCNLALHVDELYNTKESSISDKRNTKMNIAKWDGFNWVSVSDIFDGSNVHHTYLTVCKN